jgi:peptidoglycan/LPS O-acetylase OafA/YrhL
MPRSPEPGRRYVAGLDGLRAVAVLAVIAYHLNLTWARGGLLGVGVFFTLSGYLITDLLLGHWRERGHLGLGDFWLRRARRLLPALFVMLVVMVVGVAVFDAGQFGAFRKQVVAAALYLSNWWTIAEHGSYFGRLSAPLPLDHLWSLAIEEQFYLAWPWLLWLGLRAWSGPGRRALVTLALAVISVVALALLYQPGHDPTRVYEGTDTRAFELLAGAALAMVWPSRGLRSDIATGARRILDTGGVLGLLGILALSWRADSYGGFLYPDGLILLTIATTAVVAVVVHPASRLGPLLGWGPLRWVGVRSYGIYLWHWPIIVLTTPASGHIGALRGALQVLATFTVAAASWRFVEEPIRQHGLAHFVRRIGGRARSAPSRRRLVAAGFAATVGLTVVGFAGLLPAASLGPAAAGHASAQLPRPLAPASTRRSHAHALPPATRTSCRSVAYLGDSTSEGETSPNYIPNPARRLPHQLARGGVRSSHIDISGARAIIETFQGHPNGSVAAQSIVAGGFRGCWILALGTDDMDNIYDGAPQGAAFRIAKMMSFAHGRPVLWVGVVTLRGSGGYAESLMARWNRALLASCNRYPNLRVFDWPAVVKRRWFINDGIHYTSPGYVARSRLIARALVHAFPAGRPASSTCVVR